MTHVSPARPGPALAFRVRGVRAARFVLGRLARLAGLPGLLVLLGLGGCKDRACIQWSAAEGACPSRAEAIGFMPPPQCGDDEIVESVDSEGEFDEDVCCYDVTFMEDPETVPCRGF